ncbi:MAG TPA: hypothetical protein VGF59_09855, partial [Bryobacteraceae bacterium]
MRLRIGQGEQVMRALAFLAAALVPTCGLLAQVQTLSCGTPVDVTVTPPSANFFYIQAQAGDAVVVRYTIPNTNDRGFTPEVALLDPTGRPLNPRTTAFVAGASAAREYDLPIDGTYRIQVQSRNLNQIGGTLRLVYMPLNRPCTGATLQCGAGNADQITLPMQVRSYQFPARAGDVLSLRIARFSTATLPATGGFNANVFAYSAAGTILPQLNGQPAAVQTGSQGLTRMDFSVPVDGPVTFVVLDSSSGAGNYAFSVARLNGPCGGGALSCGDVVQSSLTQAVQVDSYAMTVSAGDAIFLRVAAVDATGALLPSAEVFDPTGTLVAATTTSLQSSRPVGAATFTAKTGGRYTVIAGDAQLLHTGAYAVAMARLNRPCNAQPLGCATVADGTIDSMLKTAAYTVDAKAGDIYVLRLLRTGTNPLFRPRVDIYDGQGNALQFLNTTDLANVIVTAPADGVYNLVVTDSFDSTQAGGFSIATQRLNRPCDAGTLTCGALTAAMAPRALAAAAYVYNAAPGESFSVRMIDNSGMLQPAVEVYDAVGTAVGQPSSGAYTGVDVVKPVGGAYTVLAFDANRNSTGGPFGIELLRTNNACAAAPAPQGQTMTGVVSGAAPFTSYTLPVSAGDALLVRSASSTPGFTPQMELYDPDGARIDATTFGISRRTTAGGNYTVVVGATALRGTGAFSLSWQLMNQPAAAAPLACGGSATASLSSTTEYRYYTVAANTGDLMRLIFTKLSDNFSPQVELFTPAGVRLAANSDVSQRAAADGGYLLVVGPSTSNVETGSYTIAYQRPNNPCTPVSLTCGQTTLRQANIPGQLDAFTFTGIGGDLANIRLTPRSGSYAPFVEIYDSSGKLLGSTSAGLLRPVLPLNGTYALLVRDRQGTGVGSYRVTLQDDTNACSVDDQEKPAITLLRPTGGEALAGGSTFRIQWQSDDNVGVTAHDIALSTD